MAFTITKSDGTALVTVQDQTVESSSTSLRLPGRASFNYGQSFCTDMVWLMENFANATAPVKPLRGQLWYDSGNSVMKVYTGSAWAPVAAGITVGTTPPANPALGSLWYVTATEVLCTYVNDGTSGFWLAIS